MKDPRLPLLAAGLCLLAAGAAAHFIDAARRASPWLLLAGLLMTALFFVLARLAKSPTRREADSMLDDEGNTTMMDEPSKRRDD